MPKSKTVVVATSVALQSVEQVLWEVCCLCHKSSGTLSCPASNIVVSKRDAGYETIGRNLQMLIPYKYRLQSGLLVESLQILDASENDEKILDIPSSLKKKKAKWHLQCRSKYLSPKFERTLENAKENAVVDSEGAGSKEEPQSSKEGSSSRLHTRSSMPLVNAKDDVCFICKEPASLKYPLRHCETDNVYQKVKDCARKLNDTALLAIISEGDLVAIEAKYHLICLTRLYHKVDVSNCSSEADHQKIMCESIAFANVLVYIKSKLNETPNVTFKMGEMKKSYRERVAQLLGCPEDSLFIHTTRFREKILAHFPMLIAQKSGREYILLKQGTNLLPLLRREDQDEDALATVLFLKKVRKGIKESKVKFMGKFEEGCEESCVPPSLLAIVNTLLHGSPVQSKCRAAKPALTICQLIMSNFREKQPTGDIVRNKRDYEPPLPLYMALSAYGKNRDKSSIEEMHRLGVSVSYNRINEITSQLCRRVVRDAKERNVLVPSHLKHGIFVAGAIDNIDHNPTSNTSYGSGFHGTGISIFQLPLEPNEGRALENIVTFQDVESPGVRSVPELPDFYRNVPEFPFLKKKPECPIMPDNAKHLLMPTGTMKALWQLEHSWLSHTRGVMNGTSYNPGDLNVTWSSFHAMQDSLHPKAYNALLPLFSESSDDPDMIRHAMSIIKTVTTYLNPNQVPVACGDQPTYALMKTVQWNWPDEFGESRFVALLGPLHIEKTFLRVLGQYLEGSGWVSVVAHSGITSLGSAEGFLKVSHITKARIAHQKTASALFSLLSDAYESACVEEAMSLQEWSEERAQLSPTFNFWFTLLNIEILLLTFVKSIREGNFNLYKKALKSMVPLFFTTNHTLYARWVPVHIRDMESLKDSCPEIYQQFLAGNFVMRKSGRPFSALGLDHAHEQNNASVKSRGGAIGLTEDASSLRRWTIGGPEVQRLLSEFEPCTEDDETDQLHHEQSPGSQRTFSEHGFAVKESFLHFGNPFLMESSELVALDTGLVAGEEAVRNLTAFESSGLASYTNFVQDRLIDKKLSIHDKIPQIKWHIFNSPVKKKADSSISMLKDNISLFSRLFIVCQARDFNLAEFFRHENQMSPPALSQNGVMRSGNKSLLVPILEKFSPVDIFIPRAFDGIVIDGAALMYQKKPRLASSIAEYTDKELQPFIENLAQTFKAKTLAISWDLYYKSTLKKAREARGDGLRQKDLPKREGLPKNWENYLKNSDNKTELFQFLAERLVESCKSFVFVTNVGEKFQSSLPMGTSLTDVSCAGKEEADGRIILHVKDMAINGASSVLVRCSDVDVLVLGISFYHSLKSHGLNELWFQFGVGAKQRLIPSHAISEALGREKAEALRGFHTFSGCDGNPFFASKGKPSAWNAWKEEETTTAFRALGNPLQLNEEGELDEMIVRALEKYTVALYGGDSSSKSVDEARRVLFCSGDKPLTAIPPTRSALMQHMKRSAYLAGHIWGTADRNTYSPPSPVHWGWKQRPDGEGFDLLWSSLPPIWDACRELDRCGCASDCSTRRCLCRKNCLPCSPACKKCKGECSNSSRRMQTEDEDDPPSPTV